MKKLAFLICLFVVGCQPNQPVPFYEGQLVEVGGLGIKGTVSNSFWDETLIQYSNNFGEVKSAWFPNAQLRAVQIEVIK